MQIINTIYSKWIVKITNKSNENIKKYCKIKHMKNNKEIFEQFKKDIVIDDVDKLKQTYKIRVYEWIPIIGAILYLLRMAINIAGINRGLLRKNITYFHILFVFCTIFIWHYLMIFLPIFYYIILNLSISKTINDLKYKN